MKTAIDSCGCCNHRCPVCKGAKQIWIEDGCHHASSGHYISCSSCNGTGVVHGCGCNSYIYTYYPQWTWTNITTPTGYLTNQWVNGANNYSTNYTYFK